MSDTIYAGYVTARMGHATYTAPLCILAANLDEALGRAMNKARERYSDEYCNHQADVIQIPTEWVDRILHERATELLEQMED